MFSSQRWAAACGLVAAGELIGIDVVDHVILGDARYCSVKGVRER